MASAHVDSAVSPPRYVFNNVSLQGLEEEILEVTQNAVL